METIETYKKPNELNYLDLATQNFIDAVKKNDQSLLNTPIRSGSVAAINAQMGNIAYRTGIKVFWDKEKGNFKDNIAANKYIQPVYNNGWEVPVL